MLPCVLNRHGHKLSFYSNKNIADIFTVIDYSDQHQQRAQEQVLNIQNN